MQNLGGQTKSVMVFSEVATGLLALTPLAHGGKTKEGIEFRVT